MVNTVQHGDLILVDADSNGLIELHGEADHAIDSRTGMVLTASQAIERQRELRKTAYIFDQSGPIYNRDAKAEGSFLLGYSQGVPNRSAIHVPRWSRVMAPVAVVAIGAGVIHWITRDDDDDSPIPLVNPDFYIVAQSSDGDEGDTEVGATEPDGVDDGGDEDKITEEEAEDLLKDVVDATFDEFIMHQGSASIPLIRFVLARWERGDIDEETARSLIETIHWHREYILGDFREALEAHFSTEEKQAEIRFITAVDVIQDSDLPDRVVVAALRVLSSAYFGSSVDESDEEVVEEWGERKPDDYAKLVDKITQALE